MSNIILNTEDVLALLRSIFERHNTSYEAALSVSAALLAAEIDRQYAHGLFRVESYVAQLKREKINGQACVKVTRPLEAVLQVDADYGFAYPAFDMAIEQLLPLAKNNGIAIASIFNSHHCGMASYHVERLANRGFSALLFANTPKAIAPWGGVEGVFGTNPIAFAAPRENNEPIIIDMSLSKIARGKILQSSKGSDIIESGIALDDKGKPTTVASKALQGTLLPIGDAKGYALCLMVEILTACLCGSNIGCEASSLLDDVGERPSIGQTLIVFNQNSISRKLFAQKIESLVNYILVQENTRLPGQKRFLYRELAKKNGIEISEKLITLLNKLNNI